MNSKAKSISSVPSSMPSAAVKQGPAADKAAGTTMISTTGNAGNTAGQGGAAADASTNNAANQKSDLLKLYKLEQD